MLRLNKIIAHRSQGRDKIFGVFVVFNKTDFGKEKFEAMKTIYDSNPNLSLCFGTGNVSFEGVNPNLYGTGYLTQDIHIS